MATNFEFYFKKMKDSCKEKSVGLCYLTKYSEYLNERGGCIKTCADCIEGFLEYLAQEHIEPPKLTKRERAFCEAVQAGWITRNKNGGIHWRDNEPEKNEVCWYGNTIAIPLNVLIRGCFSFVKWEDEKPWLVADLLKLEVMEVQEDA